MVILRRLAVDSGEWIRTAGERFGVDFSLLAEARETAEGNLRLFWLLTN